MKAAPMAVAAGLIADRFLGEPPAFIHPVARFGYAMNWLEQRLYKDAKGRGVVFAMTGAGAAAVAGVVVQRIGGVAAATYIAVAGRALSQAANRVDVRLASQDAVGARENLRALVGRDAAELDEIEITRAVVESVAENTVDAVVAPAFWAAVGGAPSVLAYRAINTLDAMVGHRSDRYARFGWCAARADDVANWVPARLTALLVCATRPKSAGAILRAVRTQAPAHPSPNAGVAEAAFAAALGISLGGRNVYQGRAEVRPQLGLGRRPERRDIRRAVKLERDVIAALAGLMTAYALLEIRRGVRR